ncbi:single-stranded DNA-binding protein, partial (plasmid) [Escherichia coli]
MAVRGINKVMALVGRLGKDPEV